MGFDMHSANEKHKEICRAAATAQQFAQGLSDDEVKQAIQAFARVTPPQESQATIGLIVMSSLNTTPQAQSRKPGNIFLNWKKLIDIVPDVSLAGLGAVGLPIPQTWGVVLAGLYVWNKIWRGAVEEFTDIEAITMLALWQDRNGENRISEADGFRKTNDLRASYSLQPLTTAQFTSVIDRLIKIRCLELNNGIIWLREWIDIKYR